MSDTRTQVRLRPVIRVFVSSTFSDMKHERNALQEHVFPRLEELCQRQGFQFQAIDLRWGVSTEAGLDHRAMRICCEELRRAQEISPEPNFLILLGDRYGWRPLPESISHPEFEALATAASTGGEKQTPLPGAHGKTALQILKDWYHCDENVVLPDLPETDPDRAPLNYLLQPRTQNLRDGRDYKRRKDDPTKDTQDWLDVQEVLWRLINAAFPAKGRQWFREVNWPQHVADVNDQLHPKRAIPQIARFQASATEQEIWCGALSAANAETHVIACFREITNRNDFSAAETKDLFDVVDGAFDVVSAQRKSDLKAAVELRLGENKPLPISFSKLKRENGNVIVDASEADTRAFCDAVIERIRPIIERQIEEYWDKSERGSPGRATRELEIEQDEHERFGRERGSKESFVGRDTELEAIRNWLGDNNRWPLVVHGSSGCGKTALMWRAFEDIPQTQKPIIRLIGTTPHSSDLRSLLTNLCQELRQRNLREGEIPTEIKELRDEVSQHLQAATPEQPLILFLDALAQLADVDNGRLLNWLPPGSLPTHVKLVVSCLSDRATGDPAGESYAELTRRQIPAENFINLDKLSEGEARLLLFEKWLPKAGRKVSDDQRARIEQRLASPACRQPIFLKLLFEEVQLWHSYDPAPVPGESVPALLGQLFDRLCQPTNHGPLLVNRVLGYLSASRHGLAENEILEILFADAEYRAKLNEATEQTRHELPPNAKRIPIALWSRLRFDLAPYLTERAVPGANVLTFYHRQVAEWVQEQFAKSSDPSWQPHKRLAMYFQAEDYFLESLEEQRERAKRIPPTPRPGNIRKVDELPWQRLEEAKLSGEWDAVERLLTDLLFLEAKAEAGLVFDLVGDLAQAVAALPTERPQCRVLHFLEEALQRDIYFVARHPTTLFQCMWNICSRQHQSTPALQRPVDACGHRDTIPRPAEAAGRLCDLMEDWRQLKASSKIGGVWLRSLRPPPLRLENAQRWVLSGHADRVTAVRFSPDGEWIASAAWDRTVRIWNAATGKFAGALQGHTDQVLTCAFSPDGRLIASGADDGTVRLWDRATLRELAMWNVLLGKTGPVGSVVFAPDGKRLATAVGVGIIWDSRQTGIQRPVFFLGHKGAAVCVDFSPDGRHAVSGGREGAICLWDTYTGAEVARFHGHRQMVLGVAFSKDGQRVASASRDKTVRIWDLARRKELFCLSDHRDGVESVAFSGDGLRLATASLDKTVRLWDTATGQLVACYVGHENWVHSIDFAQDGRTVVSGSGDLTVRIWNAHAGHAAPAIAGHRDTILAMEFSPDGCQLASGARDTSICLWQVDDASVPAHTGRYVGGASTVLPLHEPWISSVAFSPDGRLLASASLDGKIRILDVDALKLLFQFESRGRRLYAIAFSPDSSSVLTLEGHWVTIRDVETGRTLLGLSASLPHHIECGRCAAFSSDGALVAAGFYPGTVVVWDARTGCQLAFFQGDATEVEEVAFSPDSTVLVAAFEDDSTWAWHLEWRECLWQKHGRGNARAHAAGVRTGTWVVRWSGSELSVLSTKADKSAGWFPAIPGTTPGRHHVFASHPSGRIWAVAAGNQFNIFQLEDHRSW